MSPEKLPMSENIVFNEYCTANMARYLVRYPRGTKIAIAVKAADSRAVIQLIQEDKVKREDLVILGIPVYGMKNHQNRRNYRQQNHLRDL